MYKLIRPVCRESRDEQPGGQPQICSSQNEAILLVRACSVNIEYIILIIIYESLPET